MNYNRFWTIYDQPKFVAKPSVVFRTSRHQPHRHLALVYCLVEDSTIAAHPEEEALLPSLLLQHYEPGRAPLGGKGERQLQKVEVLTRHHTSLLPCHPIRIEIRRIE